MLGPSLRMRKKIRVTPWGLEFIVFITLKWSNFAGISSSHNITLQINQGALI